MAWPGLGGASAAHPPRPTMARGSAPPSRRSSISLGPRPGAPASCGPCAAGHGVVVALTPASAAPSPAAARPRHPSAWRARSPDAAPRPRCPAARAVPAPSLRSPRWRGVARPPQRALPLPLPGTAAACPPRRGLELGPACLWRATLSSASVRPHGRPLWRCPATRRVRDSAPACAWLVRGTSAWPCAHTCSRGVRSDLVRLAVPSARRVAPCHERRARLPLATRLPLPVYSMRIGHVVYINEMETQLRN
jgi:hypothetical protein